MTNAIIMQLRIEKTKSEKEYKELLLKFKRLMNELAVLANPYCSKVEEIDAEAIEQTGDELLNCKTKILEVQEKIRKITRDLGE